MLDPNQEVIIQTGQNELDWYTSRNTKITIKCNQGMSDPAYNCATKEARLQGFTKITLSSHCWTSSNEVSTLNIELIVQILPDNA